MFNMISLKPCRVPSERGTLDRTSSSGKIEATPLHLLEDHILSDKEGEEFKPNSEISIGNFSTTSSSIASRRITQEVGPRRSYYLQGLAGETMTKIMSTLSILGRHSCTERDSDLSELSPADPRVKRIRELKRLIAAESHDFPTSFILTIPSPEQQQLPAKALDG